MTNPVQHQHNKEKHFSVWIIFKPLCFPQIENKPQCLRKRRRLLFHRNIKVHLSLVISPQPITVCCLYRSKSSYIQYSLSFLFLVWRSESERRSSSTFIICCSLWQVHKFNKEERCSGEHSQSGTRQWDPVSTAGYTDLGQNSQI